VPQIRKLCGLPKDAQDQPVMLLLDLDDDGAFYAADHSKISTTSIETFINAYEEKNIVRQQMSK